MKTSAVSKGKRISFQLTVEPGSEVFVAGSFNNWNPMQHRMMDHPGNGHCKMTLMLPAGRHEYKFIVNGEWVTDPTSEWTPDGCGALNSVLTV